MQWRKKEAASPCHTHPQLSKAEFRSEKWSPFSSIQLSHVKQKDKNGRLFYDSGIPLHYKCRDSTITPCKLERPSSARPEYHEAATENCEPPVITTAPEMYKFHSDLQRNVLFLLGPQLLLLCCSMFKSWCTLPSFPKHLHKSCI